MAKNSVGDCDTTAGNNSDVGGISIAENCPTSNLDDALREIMAQVAALDPVGTASLPTENVTYDTVGDLLTSSEASRGAGEIWQAGGFRYEEAAAAAIDHHLTTAGGVKLYVLPSPGGYNLLAFGADDSGVSDSNDAFRAALAAIDGNGGGCLNIPAGTFSFQRNLNASQPPATATFGQKAGFVAGDNVSIRGAGREVTIFDIETPGQSAGSVDTAQFWVFLAHSDGFSCEGIHFKGNVDAVDFEFVSSWGTTNVPGFLQYANSAGTVFGEGSSVTHCRFSGTRGMAYVTSILDGVRFEHNDLSHTNGVNTSGADVSCSFNTWYYCELLEAAGEPSFNKTAGIRFVGNVCRECNGGAIGGSITTADSAQTYGYVFSDNVLTNWVVEAGSGFTVANNALNVAIDNNVILGLFTNCLTITQGGVLDCPPFDISINGGRYETTKSGTSYGIFVATAEGDVHLNGPFIKTDDLFALGVSLKSTATLFINSGTVLEGQYALGYTTGSAGDVRLSPGATWNPTTSNVTDFAANVVGPAANCTKFQPTVYTTKTAALATTQPVEVFKKAGGTQTLYRRGYFVRYMSGRMGWGDPSVNNKDADVYLDRKAAGVLGLDADDCFMTGKDTSVNRPSAAAVGAGAQFNDTTLSKPIWSDGTNWKDASGSTV
ncbi:hypothetical protein RXV86_04935 [Alisedimentitalea sp. MJ-SS2]|uniref:hypothetical protein n=1 Tax=Aliisedimentitalea sp. MJ-SS2 TaxID=3049795 RepID=UPI00291125FB|nr:hypothetical protein [Alisedimentitalea sp. MJ-SS2]MDU8926724.1 hypothetical protein [Alisedimentitalea sp. MJ-SS2]